MISEQPTLSVSGLERRLKRHFLKEIHTFRLHCAIGFEQTLCEQILTLPIESEVCAQERGFIEVKTSLDWMYWAHLNLTIPTRIFLVVASFKAFHFSELYNKSARIPWELYLGFQKKYSINVRSEASELNMLQRIADTVSQTIDYSMRDLGCQTQCADKADIAFIVSLYHDVVNIRIHCSGDLLHMRGYRKAPAFAPLRETLAASMIAKYCPVAPPVLWDPCVGSGTLLIEAMRLWASVPQSRSFAYEHWPSFQKSKFLRFKAESAQKSSQKFPQILTKFVGSDLSPEAISAARINVQRQIENCELSENNLCQNKLHFSDCGVIISNWPYGKRAASHVDVVALYSKLIQSLSVFVGWRFILMIPHEKSLLSLFQKSGSFHIMSTTYTENGGLDVLVIAGDIR